MVKVIICGACGRMGRRIIDILSQDEKTELVGAIEAKGHKSLGTQLTPKVKVTDNLEKIIA